jgi:hypothetical protein
VSWVVENQKQDKYEKENQFRERRSTEYNYQQTIHTTTTNKQQ